MSLYSFFTPTFYFTSLLFQLLFLGFSRDAPIDWHNYFELYMTILAFLKTDIYGNFLCGTVSSIFSKINKDCGLLVISMALDRVSFFRLK